MVVQCIKGLIFMCLGTFSLPSSVGYFGLAAKDPVVAVPLGEHRPSRSNKIEDYVAPSLCDMLKLHRRQKRMCKRGHGVAETLLDATSLSVEECQAKFRTERWNCTLGKYRENILKKSYKETSFLYSITSAGLVHAFARACSLQKLDRCTCDEELSSRAPRSTWIWGGCGDNIRYGLKFTRRFLGRGRKSGKDVRAEVDHHNSNLGMKVVKDHVHTTCKCHGISGSCTSKTCWRQLLPFSEIAAILKMKYERAVKVDSFKNQATGKSKLVKVRKTNSRKTRPAASPRKGEMVFLETSPSFCKRTRYSMGTSGRTCEKKSNCDVVCCGRGYNAKNAVVKKACQCKVVWCCYVECKQCEVTEEMHSCK